MKHGVSTVPCASASASAPRLAVERAKRNPAAWPAIHRRAAARARARMPSGGSASNASGCAGARVRERKAPGVQGLPGKLESRFAPAVERVVDDRVSHRRQVNANLMRPAGFEAEDQFGVPREGFAQFVVRDRGLAVAGNRELEPIARVAADRAFDRSAAVFGNAGHQPEISRSMRRAFIAFPSAASAGVVLRDDQQARGVAIEPMHESGPQVVARQRADVREQGVDERSAARAVRGMRHHAGGFVDDDHIVVFVDDRDRDRFGQRRAAAALRDLEFEDLAWARACGWPLPATPLMRTSPR